MDTICAYLIVDHKRCDDLFAQVETSVARGEWGPAEESFRYFHQTLKCHLAMEETILFPAFDKATRRAAAPIAMLSVEHQRIRGIIGRIEDALCRYDPIDFVIHSETFALLMQQHCVKEEDMLYPLLDRILADNSAEIVNAMHKSGEAAIAIQ